MNLYALSAIIYTVVLVLASCFLFYYYKNLEKKEKRLHVSEEKVMQYVQKKSEAILSETLDQAKQILKSNASLQDDFMANIQKQIASVKKDQSPKEVADQIEDWYQKLLVKITKEHLQKTEAASKTIEEIASSELQEFKKTIQEELSHSHHFISQKVKEEFSASEGEIEEYKKKKLEEIEETARKIVKQVTLYAVKKQVREEDSEKLILEALQLAKKEGVFSDL